MSLQKPEIDFPTCPRPRTWEITDWGRGDGAAARTEAQRHRALRGVSHASGEEFDASWNRNAPVSSAGQGPGHFAGWTAARGRDARSAGRRQLDNPRRIFASATAGPPPVTSRASETSSWW